MRLLTWRVDYAESSQIIFSLLFIDKVLFHYFFRFFVIFDSWFSRINKINVSKTLPESENFPNSHPEKSFSGSFPFFWIEEKWERFSELGKGNESKIPCKRLGSRFNWKENCFNNKREMLRQMGKTQIMGDEKFLGLFLGNFYYCLFLGVFI